MSIFENSSVKVQLNQDIASNTKYFRCNCYHQFETNRIVGVICLESAVWQKIESPVVTFTSATQMIQSGCTQLRSTSEFDCKRLPNLIDLQSNDLEPNNNFYNNSNNFVNHVLYTLKINSFL